MAKPDAMALRGRAMAHVARAPVIALKVAVSRGGKWVAGARAASDARAAIAASPSAPSPGFCPAAETPHGTLEARAGRPQGASGNRRTLARKRKKTVLPAQIRPDVAPAMDALSATESTINAAPFKTTVARGKSLKTQ